MDGHAHALVFPLDVSANTLHHFRMKALQYE